MFLGGTFLPGFIQLSDKQILGTDEKQASVILHAAGSLRSSLTEVVQAFTQEYDIIVKLELDHSGLIRERLLEGEYSDIFASADMANPTALMKASISRPVVNFVKNKMCAIAKPGLTVTSDNILDVILDPEIRLGTSTPNQDPSGDYAQKIFRKAEKIRPGSFEKLNQKALHLVGGRNSPEIPADKNKFAYFITETQQVDVFLSYYTGARLAVKNSPSLQIVDLPENLTVKANYGMALMNNASSYGVMLAMYILSPVGQEILAKYGFYSPLLLENYLSSSLEQS